MIAGTYPNYILHETQLEHPVQGHIVLQNVLETSPWTIFSYKLDFLVIQACPIESHQMVVMNVFHLRQGK